MHNARFSAVSNGKLGIVSIKPIKNLYKLTPTEKRKNVIWYAWSLMGVLRPWRTPDFPRTRAVRERKKGVYLPSGPSPPGGWRFLRRRRG